MNIENIKHRISLLKTKHKKQHSIVEALEAEKAPEKTIQKAKIEKLSIKDEIIALESLIVETESLNNVN